MFEDHFKKILYERSEFYLSIQDGSFILPEYWALPNFWSAARARAHPPFFRAALALPLSIFFQSAARARARTFESGAPSARSLLALPGQKKKIFSHKTGSKFEKACNYTNLAPF